MKEYIEREALMDEFRKYMAARHDREKCVSEENCKTCDKGCLWRKVVSKVPAADVAPVPQEYAYFTTMDDENYLVDLTIPVSKSQYDAINSGKDLWSVLRMDGE